MEQVDTTGSTVTNTTTSTNVPYRVGKWLPSDQTILDNWLEKHIEEATAANQTSCDEGDDEADYGYPLHPVIQKFKDEIEGNAEITMFFHQMFSQIPTKYMHKRNPVGKRRVRNYHQMLILINHILTKPPEYNDTGLVGFPINAILDWPMGTIGGYAAFLNANVNFHLKNILNVWGEYLKTKDSCKVLTREGWLSDAAMKRMCRGRENFEREFECKPDEEYYGFTSWDDFFTRKFKPDVRPVKDPGNNKVIVNACESAPYKIERNVQKCSKFWIKGQPYNLKFMLDEDPLTDCFLNGTVYQAFLSALSYHRWHSPVNGIIKKTRIIDGTYYSEALIKGFINFTQDKQPTANPCPDNAAPNDSQGYITEVATRALIFIEADNPYIGLMCFMAVGMAEVSTCEITVTEEQWVRKGEQIGMFHFGGSTHCLIFRRGVELDFHLHSNTEPSLEAENIHVNAKIATVPTDIIS